MEIAGACYFASLKSPERLQAVLRILPPGERQRFEQVLSGLKGMAPEQIATRWASDRQADRLRLLARADRHVDGTLSRLPGRLRQLMIRRAMRER
ncbi:MAG: hypothetical protein ACKV22_12845 [Bryobacteraceae bacterium]